MLLAAEARPGLKAFIKFVLKEDTAPRQISATLSEKFLLPARPHFMYGRSIVVPKSDNIFAVIASSTAPVKAERLVVWANVRRTAENSAKIYYVADLEGNLQRAFMMKATYRGEKKVSDEHMELDLSDTTTVSAYDTILQAFITPEKPKGRKKSKP